MQHTDAVRLIRRTFESAYDETNLRTLIAELFHKAENKDKFYSGAYIPTAYRDHISSYKYICKYITPNNDELAVLAVNCTKAKTLESARTLQRNFVANYMKEHNKDACLVAFYSDEDRTHWRFSFVRFDNSFNFDTLKEQNIITPAKRFSYMVGAKEASHTAQQQLCQLLEASVKNPELSDIENAFAVERVSDSFFEHYKELFLRLVDNIQEIIDHDQRVRFEFVNKNISAELFCKKLMGQIVFLYFIQKKGWLGVETCGCWGSGDRHFMRSLFERAVNNGDNYFNDYLEPLFYEGLASERKKDCYFDKLGCRIPFLNGGLFDAMYNWQNTDIKLDNNIFSNKDNSGILDVFDTYNFTVREDEPLEKEIAVDPEMLGKVFENLLEIHDRKSKGAFYTPREIVHYMCQQSLIQYINSKLDGHVSLSDIEFLVHFGDVYSEIQDKAIETESYETKIPEPISRIKNFAEQIDNALATVKICDPAVGSGAFPVGMMHEIIRVRQTLLNSGFIKADRKHTVYEYKRQIIKDSIYGVDIEESAVEIAKLRLWLSLVVDEDDITNIKPLPNLDFKIVCGNSLTSIDKNLLNNTLVSELETIKDKYFDSFGSEKAQYTKRMKTITEHLLKKEHFDLKVCFSDVFKVNSGFDIVIGNPPYFKYEGEHKNEIPIIKQQDFFKYCGGGKINAYRAFIAMSLHRITRPKGILCMIFQNSFLGDSSVAGLRKYVMNNHDIIQIDSFPERDNVFKRVFSNVKMSVCILMCKANIKTTSFTVNVYTDKYFNKNYSNIFTINDIEMIDPKNFTIPMIDPIEFPLLKKLLQTKQTIGLKTIEGEINMTFHKHLLSENNADNPEVLKGAAIQRYHITKKMSQGKREFLNVVQYEKENTGQKTKHHKYDRIAMQGMTGVDDLRRLIMTYIPKGLYLANSCNYIILPTATQAFYVLGILNSKLINWIFKKTSTNSNVNCYEVDALPIVKAGQQETEEMSQLVENILNNRTAGANTAHLEDKIDKLVYKLYNLTDSEIAVVEKLYSKN